MIKLVVWDWNGTLLSDVSITLQAVNEATLPLFDLPGISLQKYRDIFDIPIMKNYLALGVTEEEFLEKSDTVGRLFQERYDMLRAGLRTRSGAKQTLRTLAEKNVSSIILSNHIAEDITLQLQRFEILPYFETILANDIHSERHFTGKQHRMEQYLADHNVQPSETIIVGDTLEEIQIGKSLGLHTVAISGGFCSRARLTSAKPDYLISSVKQIVTIVEGIA